MPINAQAVARLQADPNTVKFLQKSLGLADTGAWDQSTASAVEGFQMSKGWNADFGMTGNADEWGQFTGALTNHSRSAYDPLSPFDLVQYDTAGQKLRTEYGNRTIGNQYKRDSLGLNHQRAQDKLTSQFHDYRQQLPGGFSGRGLINSGMYQNALSNYSKKKLEGQTELNFDYTQGLGGLATEQLQTENTFRSGLSSIEAERQARRAQMASQLREIG